jgi:hypothetical protein
MGRILDRVRGGEKPHGRTAQAELNKINLELKNEFKNSPKEVADQMVKSVLPGVKSAIEEAERRLSEEMRRFNNQHQANRRGAMAGGE